MPQHRYLCSFWGWFCLLLIGEKIENNVWLWRLLMNLSKMTLHLVWLFLTIAKSTQATSIFNLQIAKAFRLIAQVGLIAWGIGLLSAHTPLN